MNKILIVASLLAVPGLAPTTGHAAPVACARSMERSLLEGLALFGGTTVPAKAAFIRATFPGARVVDGIRGVVFDYTFIATDLVDKKMQDQSFEAGLRGWARKIGEACGQVREVRFAIAGGDYVRTSRRSEGFSGLCRKVGSQPEQCN